MKRTHVTLVALLCVAAGGSSLAADTRTAEGVAAFLRRDYGRAAELLVPAANDPWQQDAVADFRFESPTAGSSMPTASRSIGNSR